MIVEWKILLLTLPFALLLLIGCYGTGELVYRGLAMATKKQLSLNNTATVFWKIIAGIFILVGVYAAIITELRTSLLPVPILAAAMLTTDMVAPGSPDNKKDSGFLNSPWIFLFAGLFIYWLFYALHYLLNPDGFTGYIGADSLFYARSADHLNFSGSENVTINYEEGAWRGVEPYHYGDIWMIAMVQKLTRLTPALITPMIIYPVLAAIFCLGLKTWLTPSVSEKYKQLTWLIIFSGLTSGISFLFPSIWNPRSLSLSIPLVGLPKLFFAGIILVGILLSLQNKSWNRILLLASAGTLLYINTAPAILITLGILFLYVKFWQRDRLSIKPVAFILSALSLIYYFLFYKIYPSGDFTAGIQPFRIRTFINIIGAVVLQFFPLLPFLLLVLMIWFNDKKRKQPLRITNDILFLAAVPFVGLLCWGLMYAITPEAIQFFYNILIPVAAIFILLIVINVVQHLTPIWKIMAISIYLLSVLLNCKKIQDFAANGSGDMQAVFSFVEKNKPGTFVNLRSNQEFSNLNQRNTMLTHPLPYMNYHYPSYYNISLNAPFLPIDPTSIYPDYEKKLQTSTPFGEYIKNRDTLVPMQEYAYLFITERRIRYLAISPDTVIPTNLRQLAKDSIHLSNRWHIYYLEK